MTSVTDLQAPSVQPGTPAPRRPQPTSAIRSTAWTPTENLDLAEWIRAGQRLGMIGRCSQWWLGDWIRYGNVKFGEKYSRAAKITGYDVQTLMNIVYVVSRFEVSRRREDLSWSHHETVASLQLAEQERWLDRAIEHKLSVADLRLELRSERAREKALALPEAAGDEGIAVNGIEYGEAAVFTCPNCGHRIQALTPSS